MTRVEAKHLSEMMLTMGRNMLRLGSQLRTMAEAKKPKKKARRVKRTAGAEFSTF